MKYSINCKEPMNKSKNNLIMTPQTINKKIKKCKLHNNKNIKLELITKNTSHNKKGGIETLLAKMEKEKEKEKEKQQTDISKNNIIKEKLQLLDNLKKKEKEYLLKIREKKKALTNEINFFKKKLDINEEG
jgi:hypothetical protein